MNFSKSILLFSPEGKLHSSEKSSLPGFANQTMKNLYSHIACQASSLTAHNLFSGVTKLNCICLI